MPNRVRAVLVGLVLLLLGVATPTGAAFALPEAGPPEAVGPGSLPLPRQADPGAGGSACVGTPASEDGTWYVGPGDEYVKVDGCDARSGSITYRMPTLTSGSVPIIAFYKGAPGDSAVFQYVYVDQFRRTFSSGGAALYGGTVPAAGANVTLTWSVGDTSTTYTVTFGTVSTTHVQNHTGGNPGPLTFTLGGYSASSVRCNCPVAVGQVGGEAWPEPAAPPEPCPSWLPSFLCGAGQTVGDLFGPITEGLGGLAEAIIGALGSLGSSLLAALGSVGNVIVAAVEGIAEQIWLLFQSLVLDPDEVGPWWDDFTEDVKASSLGTGLEGVWATIESMVPAIDQRTVGTVCVKANDSQSAAICLGDAIDSPPSPIPGLLEGLLYGWAFITWCYLAGVLVKTVRR